MKLIVQKCILTLRFYKMYVYKTCSLQVRHYYIVKAGIIQGLVVQSIVSLTSSLVVKMLTFLVSTITNSWIFLLENVSSFCICKSYSYFFSKTISVYAIFNDQSFNDTSTNDMLSFKQLTQIFRTLQFLYSFFSFDCYFCTVAASVYCIILHKCA